MTLWYRAPEVILDNLEYSPAIDLWSVGVIIYEMLTGQYMFQGNSEIDMLFKIFWLKVTPKPDEFKNFESYPHLQNYGVNFPKFKKRNLLDF
jgi:serine/threonine protein kinase